MRLDDFPDDPAANLDNDVPIADAGNDQVARLGTTLYFMGNGSHDPDGIIVNYTWDFGDGKNASGINASHSYDMIGTYNVTLTVIDDDGGTGKDTCIVIVKEKGVVISWVQIHWNISENAIYAIGQEGEENESATVTIHIEGKGEELVSIAGTDIEIMYEKNPELNISNYGSGVVDGTIFVWSREELKVGETWNVTFDLSGGDAFNGSIGTLSYKYSSWDGEHISGPLAGGDIELKIGVVKTVDLVIDDGVGGSKIIANKF